MICGVTKQTVYKNFLAPLFDIVGPKNYTYNKNSGKLTLFGVPWIVEGAAHEGAVRRLQGLTIGVLVIEKVANIRRWSSRCSTVVCLPEEHGSTLRATRGVTSKTCASDYSTTA